MHTAEIKILVEPDLKAQVNEARGLVSLSAWVRDAIEMKLKLCPDRDYRYDSRYSSLSKLPVVQLPTLYPPEGEAVYVLPEREDTQPTPLVNKL